MRTHTIAVVMILVPLGLFAGLGHASATHSAMTVSISPPTIEKGIWHNFSMTVHNDGANPVAIGQIEISFSWTTGGYFVTYLYGPPDFGQIVVDGAKIFNLGDIDEAGILPTEGTREVLISLNGGHWYFRIDLSPHEQGFFSFATRPEFLSAFALTAALIGAPVAFILIRSLLGAPPLYDARIATWLASVPRSCPNCGGALRRSGSRWHCTAEGREVGFP